MLNDTQLAERKALMEKDDNLKKYFQEVLKDADEVCKKPKLVRNGAYNNSVSHECVNRIYAFGFAWRITGEEK